MAPTCLIATNKAFDASARDEIVRILKEGGVEVKLLENYKTPAELDAAVVGVDGIIIRSDDIKKDILEKAPTVKCVIRAGAGTDNVEKEVKTAIVVENTPGQNSQAVAELVIGMAIMMYRKMYDGSVGLEINHKTLGLGGFGEVPRHLVETLKGFNMKISAYDPFVDAEAMKKCGVTKVEKLEDLFTCDIVSLHMPKTTETVKCINAAMLGKYKGMVINTAREEVVDEDAIIEAFKTKSFIYATDVAPKKLEEMKAAGGNRFYASAKKCGAQTVEANTNAGIAAAKQMVEFLVNGKVMFQVKK